MAKNERIQAVAGGRLEYLPFEALPVHDSVWGLCTGKDGMIYASACGECTGGLSVFILRYDPAARKLEYLLEVGPAVGQPPDNGHATQCKIHYCLLPGSDGLLYCATHASGPPLGDPIWRPWNCWDDPVRNFPGSYLFTYDPASGRLDNFGIGPLKEGSRALALDEKRRKLYGLTWPRNHFYVYYLDQRRYLDLGRIGDINPQAIFLDRAGNAYTTDDYGWILRCEAGRDRLQRLGVQCPSATGRTGWHNVPYDVVPAPDWSCFYGTDWGFESRLWRYDPYAGGEGRMDDLGPAFPLGPARTERSMEHWQVRGLVFGADGKLYYTMRLPEAEKESTWLLRLDPSSGKREKVGRIRFGEHEPVAIASATPDFYGNLYFAEAGLAPTGMYIYRPTGVSSQPAAFSFKDIKPWG